MWWVISRLRSTSDKYIRMFVNHIGDCQRAYRTTEQIFQKNASQFQCWERDSKCTSHLGRIHWRGVRTCTDARKTLNSPCNVPNSKNVFFNWRELSLRYWQITCFSSLNFWKSFFVDWVCTEKKNDPLFSRNHNHQKLLEEGRDLCNLALDNSVLWELSFLLNRRCWSFSF